MISENIPVLSFGGGVNSVALYLLLKQQGMVPGEDFIALMADPGAERPETYEYLAWMQKEGHLVTVIPGRYEGHSLLEYCRFRAIIPSRVLRWCTHHFKLEPIQKYLRRDVDYIAFSADEAHRTLRTRPGREISFPLIEHGIDRDGCIALITAAGWPVPVKSGCWFCPFQAVGEWEALPREHPGLFAQACAMEDHMRNSWRSETAVPFYLPGDIPIRVMCSGPGARRLWRRKQKGQTNFMADLGLDPCWACSL